MITYPSVADLLPVLARLGGNLAGVVHADEASAADMELAGQVAGVLARTVGRVVFNGWPTGVAVTSAQHHGGPWPASTAPAYTSVGAAAIRRWLVPVAYQDFPAQLLPGGPRQPQAENLLGVPWHRRLTALAGPPGQPVWPLSSSLPGSRDRCLTSQACRRCSISWASSLGGTTRTGQAAWARQ